MKTESSTIADLAKNLRISMQSTLGLAQIDADGWEHISFQVSITRNGKPVWNGPYMLGLGHVKVPAGEPPFTMPLTSDERSLFYTVQRKPNCKVLAGFEHVKTGLFTKLAQKQNLQPKLDDVLYSLISDGSAHFDNEDFSEWCSNFGYSDDSRKAKKTWKECYKIGRSLSRAFNREELDALREAASEM